ncbi:MAG: hypothetical protein Tsb0010_10600 [Parvularculaceae bacterium]
MAFGSETEAAAVHNVWLVKIQFPGFTARVHSYAGELTHNAETYVGAGELVTISPLTSQTELVAETVDLTLSGVDPTLIAEAKDVLHQGSPVEIFFAYLDPATGAFVTTPQTVFVGEVDTETISIAPPTGEGEAKAVISLRAESALRRLFRRNVRRRTDEDQNQLFAGDRFNEFVPDLAGPFNWGRPDPAGGVTRAAGGGGARVGDLGSPDDFFRD